MSLTPITTVVFDLGGVLIDWDPRYLYRTLFDGDDAAMERFLAEICTPAWNRDQDAGRPWSQGVAELTAQYPEWGGAIEAFDSRWPETLGGAVAGTLEILGELKETPVRLMALSNWSAEKFPIARARFEFLDWFDAIVISGEVGACKPDPAIYERLIERHHVVPATTLFVDDSPENAATARRLGFVALDFVGPDRLRFDLEDLELLKPARARGS